MRGDSRWAVVVKQDIPQPGRRSRVELEAGDSGKRPPAGKRGARRPRESPRLPSQAFLQARASHEPQGSRGTYKTVHIWPDGAAFPRNTWPRNPGTQLPPFTDRRRKRIHSRADLRDGRLPAGPSPSCSLPGGRQARCCLVPQLPSPPLRGLEAGFSGGVRPGLHPPEWHLTGRLGRPVA